MTRLRDLLPWLVIIFFCGYMVWQWGRAYGRTEGYLEGLDACSQVLGEPSPASGLVPRLKPDSTIGWYAR